MKPIVRNVDSLMTKMRGLIVSKRTENGTIAAGYATPYALVVHEQLQEQRRTGQAKYLEQPTRQEEGKVKELVYQNMMRGKTLNQSLLVAANHIMEVSLKMVPVDTGMLKRSNFVIVEKGPK